MRFNYNTAKPSKEVAAMVRKRMKGLGLPIKVRSVEQVNHTPHPYVVGPKHIEHANKVAPDGMGMLGEKTMRAISSEPCIVGGKKVYGTMCDDIEFDVVLFIQLTDNITGDQMQEFVAYEQMRPSTIHKPRLAIDGNQWCALYGDNLQDGVSGFGDSPAKAYEDFDKNWYKALTKIKEEQSDE